MSILYFHGLDRPANETEKMTLSAYGSLLAPEIDYQPDGNFISFLNKAYSDLHITAVVGTSMGGLVAYVLSAMLNTPCLLFNPTLGYANVMEYEIPVNCRREEYLRVVLGQHDDVVDHAESIRIINMDTDNNKSLVEISLKSGLKHSVPQTEFEREVDIFFTHLLKPVAI